MMIKGVKGDLDFQVCSDKTDVIKIKVDNTVCIFLIVLAAMVTLAGTYLLSKWIDNKDKYPYDKIENQKLKQELELKDIENANK